MQTTHRILTIGDHFLLPGIMKSSVTRVLPSGLDFIEATTPFPLEPFENIGEVREASGSEDDMIEHLHGIEICVAHHAPFTKRVLDSSPDLKLVVICRGGPVNVNLDAATANNIIICNAPGRNAAATAEHAVAMLLATLRGIPAADAAMRRSQWRGDYTYSSAPFELESATVGLVGYGAIGRIVARILKGFGSTVLTYDPFAGIGYEEGVEQVSLDELLQRSNAISLHARETSESRGMIGAKQIAQMPRGSVLINCARGSLLDYNALYDALADGHLYAAAADVFDQEPLPANYRLLQLPNFVMTPHIAGGTKQAAQKAADIAAGEVLRFLTRQLLRHCANPAVLSARI